MGLINSKVICDELGGYINLKKGTAKIIEVCFTVRVDNAFYSNFMSNLDA